MLFHQHKNKLADGVESHFPRPEMCISSRKTDTFHFSGVDNVTADELSRWDFHYPLPPQFNHANRIRIDLKDLWLMRIHPIVVPPSTYLAWNLPT
jgi:hypothetical protein